MESESTQPDNTLSGRILRLERRLNAFEADQRSHDRLTLAGQILAGMYANSELMAERVTFKQSWSEIALREADALLAEHEQTKETQDEPS